MIRLATDVGGTFTDLLGYDEQTGRIYSAKSLTTVEDQSRGVLTAIGDAVENADLATERVSYFIHGGTTVINAITERKGVKTALVTTDGFRDVLEIGRGNRPDLYNLKFHSPRPFVERDYRYEVAERVALDGSVIVPLDEASVRTVGRSLAEDGVEAVAIMFLHSYAYPDHEKHCAAILAEMLPGTTLCCSHEVSQLWREFERTNTVVLNAYVKPIITRYFHSLERALIDAAVRCPHYAMQSNGGVASFRQATETPLALVESGPSGGIAGAARIGELLGENNILALDVGGTTAKCSVIKDGRPRVESEYRLEWSRINPGYPVQVPVVDIVELGAGGGSIAWVDDAGGLRVGPESAGAAPGPACYGLGGTLPTVTDAKLIIGVLDAKTFAEGSMALDEVAAHQAVSDLGKKLGLSPEQAAQAIIDVAEANMINALKLVTIQRGHDPRDFCLVVSGGAGPMFAAKLGRELGVKSIVIPPHSGVFSAWGMLAARPRVDMRKTYFAELKAENMAAIAAELNALESAAKEYFGDDGSRKISFTYAAEMRYRGQEHSVASTIGKSAATEDVAEEFHKTHKAAYSFSLPDAAIEVTGLHLLGELHGTLISCPLIDGQNRDIEQANLGARRVYLGDKTGWQDCPVYRRERLPIEQPLAGPLLIEEQTTTSLVLSGQEVVLNERGIMIIKQSVAP
ncbi:MAG: hydantoinase/oxoprolinase family protein [Alphaproteobacteria bacterium]